MQTWLYANLHLITVMKDLLISQADKNDADFEIFEPNSPR